MSIMVTGGLGFIGSHICRYLLDKGQEVVILDDANAEQVKVAKTLRISDIADRLKIVSGSICNFPELFQIMKENNVDKVIHTAAIIAVPVAVAKPCLAFKVNVEGTFNILEAARILNLEKVLYVSTASVYGDFQVPVVKEDHPLEPKDIYGATKLAADRIAISYNRTYGMNTAVARTTAVYGPGGIENNAAKIFIESALTGKEIRLEGGGTQLRDFSYVKDVARGISMALLSDRTTGDVVHIANGGSHTVKELAELVAKFIPGTRIVDAPQRKIAVDRGQLDISKARDLLGFIPEYGLEQGVNEYVKWMHGTYAPFFGLAVKNRPVFA